MFFILSILINDVFIYIFCKNDAGMRDKKFLFDNNGAVRKLRDVWKGEGKFEFFSDIRFYNTNSIE